MPIPVSACSFSPAADAAVYNFKSNDHAGNKVAHNAVFNSGTLCFIIAHNAGLYTKIVAHIACVLYALPLYNYNIYTCIR